MPIALPGIVTGIALNNAFRTSLGIDLGLFTAIVAHATFCIVVVFNNVVARLRRMGGNLEGASMDLGADGLTTFRLVTFLMLRSALLAGGLLAFALSFGEIIVTTFNLFRPNQAPIVNVVATAFGRNDFWWSAIEKRRCGPKPHRRPDSLSTDGLRSHPSNRCR